MPPRKKAPYRRRPARRKPRYAAKRRTFKGGYKYAKIPTQIMPNNLFVKLNYSKSFTVTGVAANSFSNLVIGGNHLAPTGPDQSDNFPLPPNHASTIVASGSQLWAGLQGFAEFYNDLTIFSNKLTFKLITDSTGGAATNVNIQVVAGAWNNATDTSTLNALDTKTLMDQKGQVRRVVAGGTGQNKTTIVMKRSTKTMLGMKNVRDGIAQTNCQITPGFNVTNLTNPNPNAQWYYYIRVFNPNSIPVDFTWSLYLQCNALLHSRAIWKDVTANTNPPPGGA